MSIGDPNDPDSAPDESLAHDFVKLERIVENCLQVIPLDLILQLVNNDTDSLLQDLTRLGLVAQFYYKNFEKLKKIRDRFGITNETYELMTSKGKLPLKSLKLIIRLNNEKNTIEQGMKKIADMKRFSSIPVFFDNYQLEASDLDKLWKIFSDESKSREFALNGMNIEDLLHFINSTGNTTARIIISATAQEESEITRVDVDSFNQCIQLTYFQTKSETLEILNIPVPKTLEENQYIRIAQNIADILNDPMLYAFCLGKIFMYAKVGTNLINNSGYFKKVFQ